MKKVVLYTMVALLGLVLVGGAAIYAYTESRRNRKIDVSVSEVHADLSADAVARGRRLFTTRGCRDCHGEDGGGRVVIDDPGIGRVVGANLTGGAGGAASRYHTDADWDRSIRYGVNPEGRPLYFMPAQEFHGLSKRDTAALIAFVRSLPPVSRQNPKIVMGPLARVLYLAGKFPLAFPHDLIPTDAPAQPEDIPATADAAYGSYLAQGCVGCHRPSLKGGPIAGVPPDWPPAADISADTGRIARWDFEQFKTLMRTGTTPDGRKLNPMYMPWMNIGRLEDVELQGLFAFLQSRR